MSLSNPDFHGKAIIISAPSGSGKTTIAKHLISANPHLQFSISACTRNPRAGKEKEGEDYYFISLEDFHRKIENQEFVEWEEVYEGMFYGTLKSEVERIWSNRKHILFDVDVKGGLKLKEYFGADALAIFIKAPTMTEIEKRLSGRKTESDESLQKRLKKIEAELQFENSFDVTIINDSLEEAKTQTEKLIINFLSE